MDATVTDPKKNNREAPENGFEIEDRLGEKIRQTYSDVMNAPVPDRFIDLLNQLEEADRNKKSEG